MFSMLHVAKCSFKDVGMGLGTIGTDPKILHGRWLPLVKIKLYWCKGVAD